MNLSFLLKLAKPALETWLKTRALVFPQAKKIEAANAIEKKFGVAYLDAIAIVELVQAKAIEVAVANVEKL